MSKARAKRAGPISAHDTRLISQLYASARTRHSYTSIAFVDFQGLREADTSDLLPMILPFAETERVLHRSVAAAASCACRPTLPC